MPEAKTFGGGGCNCITMLTDAGLQPYVEDTLTAAVLFQHIRNPPFLLATANLNLTVGGLCIIIAEVIDDGSGIYTVSLDGVPQTSPLIETDVIGTNVQKRFFVALSPITAGAHVLTLDLTAGVNVALYNAKLIDIALACSW